MISYDQMILLIILTTALVFFISGIVRYDVVSSLTLLAAVFLGLVPAKNTFIGFSHSAVVTVAAVFIISRAVENTGILSEIANYLRLKRKDIPKQIASLSSVVMLLSAFINNVGAVALMIPVALKIARVKNIPRGKLLMPLAFSSLLGGLITLIGTPPNIIISDFRRYNAGGAYYFFDFTPVGLGVSIVGLVFIALIGWRWIPETKDLNIKSNLENFTVELKVKSRSSLVNKKIASLMEEYAEKVKLLALVRDDEVIKENLNYLTVKTNDHLILETDKWTVGELIDQYKLQVSSDELMDESQHFLTEVAILPQSPLCDCPIKELKLLPAYGIEIIAVSRNNITLTDRLSDIILRPGDVLLITSTLELTHDKLDDLKCIIMEEKHIRLFSKKDAIKVLTIFIVALAAIISGLVRVDVAFFSAAVAMVISRCLSLEKAYRSINLPIIILIGTLIPVGEAMETTGTAKLLAQTMYYYGQVLPIGLNLFILILVCMLLSNLINNAAVALIFSPIALQIAADWQASPDPFLMGIAIGASCAFLTPIGHQSNTLVLGPGNYRFSDYWQMGLPLSILTAIVATGLIMLFWPF